MIKKTISLRSVFRRPAFSSLPGASPPASSALFDEKHPRKSIRFFNHEAVLIPNAKRKKWRDQDV